ncbi:GNAT family N-acetyltransferase [Pseudomonas chlororaphis]|uniref:N-acetyltransferase domain-containing protein n=1 Tax=Pseudomonas chlororaphis TaxID=587753 RepID=A0A1Q8ESJ2_9PSED|nr:GNAT family N-acetyltransferase [Pseudomonas chlororaphis]OLF54753.1 hypothetical protein BTN82_12260 [Pseudomonas chlororaphis]
MIAIREIDATNCLDVCELTSNKDGVGTVFEAFVCCNATSLVESRFFPGFEPRALYRDAELIGFFMYQALPSAPGEVELCRYMLDHKFLGQGLGRLSFEAMLAYFKGQGAKGVTLMIEEANAVAKNLYLSFGFAFTGKILKDEHYYHLDLDRYPG